MKTVVGLIASLLFISTAGFAQDYYWIGNGGDWKDISHWSLTSGVVDPPAVLPGKMDNVIFNASSFTLPNQVVTIADDGSSFGVYFRTMDWRGVTNTPTFRIRTTTSTWVSNGVTGSIYFDTNMTLDFLNAEFYFASTTDYEFDPKGHDLGEGSFPAFNLDYDTGPASNVVCNLLSDLNSAYPYIPIGTLRTNGHNVTTKQPGYLQIVGSGVVDITGAVLDLVDGPLNIGGTGTIIDDNAEIIMRGGTTIAAVPQDFNHFTVAGPNVSFTGADSHTFQTLEIRPDAKITLNSGIQTVNTLIANGTETSPVAITGGTIQKSTGTVNIYGAHLLNTTATGGATFRAINSWDDGGNTGWTFIEVASQSDSLALIALYNSTNGSGWTNKTNWLTGPVSTWYGVTVVGGRVKTLNLINNNLSGTLPAQLGDLSALTHLLFYNNHLSGSIPPELGNLSALIEFGADDNQLSGSIPAAMGNLSVLEIFTVSRNQLSGTIPAEIGNLTALNQLWLDNNQFIGAVPSTLSNLTSVQLFFIGNNMLTDLPDLSTLNSTTAFSVINNKFTFEDLEPNISIPAFTYAPQDSVELKTGMLRQVASSDSIVAVVGGTSNTFKWYKNNTVIPGATTKTIIFPNIALSDDAFYRYEVTNSLLPGLTLYRRPIELKVSSLYRDSIALRTLYNSTEGSTWTNKSNWLTTPLKTGNWFGITITNNRVTQVNLPNNNLKGPVSAIVADIQNLTSLNLSNNKITALPDLTTYPSISTLNVSRNNLDFASLEKNASISGINYSGQADLGTPLDVQVAVGEPVKFDLVSGGTNNTYQWKRNGQTIAGATASSYEVSAIGRSNMGDYVLEITNASVPGLTLKSATQRAIAIANISGKLQVSASTPVNNGKLLLLKVIPGGVGYDTTRIQNVKTDGTYLLDNVVLDDYVLVGLGDIVQYKDYFPTYFNGSVFWENATTIALNENRVGVDITLQTLPTVKPSGDGQLSGTFSVDDLAGGRTMRERVQGAGASVRRGTKSGRPTDTLDGEDIVAFLYTNENGEFDFKDLDEGSYILNIQYPGVPMDPESDIYITLGPRAKRQNVQKVEAVAEDGKITVKRLIIVGLEEDRNDVVKVYPNPAAEELFIELETGLGEGVAVLTDMTGKEHRRVLLQADTKVMDVKDISSGIYVLTIHQQNKQISRSKIVIK